MVLLLCLKDLDFGPMEEKEEAAQAGDLGDFDAPIEESVHISERGRVSDMLIPVIALIIFSILAMLQNGGLWGDDPAYHTIMAAFGNCSASDALVLGGFGALIVAFILFIPRKLVTFHDFMSGIESGVKNMVPAYLILIMAWTISGVCRDLLDDRRICPRHCGELQPSPGHHPGTDLRHCGIFVLLHGHSLGHLRYPDSHHRTGMLCHRAAADHRLSVRHSGRQCIRRSLLPDF